MHLSHLNLLYPRDRTRQQPKESKLRIFENVLKMVLKCDSVMVCWFLIFFLGVLTFF